MLDEEDEKLLPAKPRRRRGAGPEEEEGGKQEGGDSARGRPTSREQRDSERAIKDAKSPRQEEDNAQTPGRRRHRNSTSKVVPFIAEVDNHEAAYFEEADATVEGGRRRGQKPGRARRSSEGASHVDKGARKKQHEEEDLGTDYL
jgi:hypothetical protein